MEAEKIQISLCGMNGNRVKGIHPICVDWLPRLYWKIHPTVSEASGITGFRQQKALRELAEEAEHRSF